MLAVKEDEALDPVDAAFLDTRGVVFEADSVANLLHELVEGVPWPFPMV